MSDVGGAVTVQVAVRVRPFNEREISENARECLQYFVEKNQLSCCGRMFAFDAVFDPSTTQDSVYDACAAPMIDKLFAGYNCTLLAYGQTGSGKTYTMGTEETVASIGSEGRGIISRMVSEVFRRMDSEPITVLVSMLEIYEEKVFDLLSASAKEPLSIREKEGAVFVQGLSEVRVQDLASTMEQLEKGCLVRSKGETAMNKTSSRSHAVFTLTIEKSATNEEDMGFVSKLALVDLAGSERLKKTQAEGERMREGIKINSGLLALGNVISALAEGPNSSRHVPYRDSKITRLLQTSLGGNSYTLMIACVSPADSNGDETMSTLTYANRAKKITNKPTVNADPNALIIQQLREKVADLEMKLAVYSGERPPSLPTSERSVDDNFERDQRIVNSIMVENLERQLGDAQDQLRRTQTDCQRIRLLLMQSAIERTALLEKYKSLEEQHVACQNALSTARDALREKVQANGTEGEMMDILGLLNTPKVQLPEVDDDEHASFLKEDAENDAADGTEGMDDEGFAACVMEEEGNLKALTDDVDRIMKEIDSREKAREALAADEIKKVHEKEMEQERAKLKALEEEKLVLLRQLKEKANSQKLSEERRRKLNELEKEVCACRKRIGELQKKEKENAVLIEKHKKLSSEILELKKTRVLLIRKMKEFEGKVRQWKARSEREMIQLKSKERKRMMEMSRKAALSEKRLETFMRRNEAANALIKRLQERNHKRNKATRIVSLEQYMGMLDDDLSLAYSVAEAGFHLRACVSERQVLSSELNELESQRMAISSRPPAKRRTGGDRSSFDDETQKKTLDEKIGRLKDKIESTSARISELMAKKASVEESQLFSDVPPPIALAALKEIFARVVSKHEEVLMKDEQLDKCTAQMVEHESVSRQRERLLNEKIERLIAELDRSNAVQENKVEESKKPLKRSSSRRQQAASSQLVDAMDEDEESDESRDDPNDLSYNPNPVTKRPARVSRRRTGIEAEGRPEAEAKHRKRSNVKGNSDALAQNVSDERDENVDDRTFSLTTGDGGEGKSILPVDDVAKISDDREGNLPRTLLNPDNAHGRKKTIRKYRKLTETMFKGF